MKSHSMHLRGNCILVGFVLLGLLITGAEAGVRVILGGTTGWTNEANVDYTKWVSSFNLKVGDTLVFDNNDASDHSVLIMNKAGYDACDVSASIGNINTISSGYFLEFTFLEPGWRYFICGNPGHCLQGQKVNFDVLNADGTKNSTTSISNPNVSAASRVDLHPALTRLAPLGVVTLVNAASFFFF